MSKAQSDLTGQGHGSTVVLRDLHLGAGGPASSGLEAQVLSRVESRLQEFQASLVSCLGDLVASRVESVVDARIKKAVHPGSGGSFDAAKMKGLIVDVLQSTLVESGLLEKAVERVVAQRGGPSAPGGGGEIQGQLRDECVRLAKEALTERLSSLHRDIQALIQKETAAFLSSENLKVLIDDKFRAISLYLKTDVIPKTVQQILKGTP